MNTSNKVLMTQAREVLTGKWRIAINAALVLLFAEMLLQNIPGTGGLIGILLGGPFLYGTSTYWLAFSRGQDAKLLDIFRGFYEDQWVRSMKAYLLMALYIFLRFLLLIVPGIIASLAYSQTFYILAEDPNIGYKEAILKSKEMMKGNKWKLFCLQCRFIGWFLLSILTLFIGLLWLMPYMQVSMAKFYDDVKNPKTQETLVHA